MKVFKVWSSFIIGLLLSSVVLIGCGSKFSPATPSGVTASPGNGQVVIAWMDVPNATSYNIYYSTSSGVTSGTKTNGTLVSNVSNPYTLMNLTNGTTYYFVVTAVSSSAESLPSSQVSATPSSTVLSAPTNVMATPGNGQVSLAWTAVAGAISYNIYYSTISGVTSGPTTNGILIANATNPNILTGLAYIPYYFVVTAVYSNSVESAASPQVSAIPAVNPALPEPVGVTANPGNGQANILWTAVTGATSYNIYYSTTSGVTPANGIRITGLTSPSFTHTNLVNGTTYYYVVTAVNSGNATESTPSVQVSVTPAASS